MPTKTRKSKYPKLKQPFKGNNWNTLTVKVRKIPKSCIITWILWEKRNFGASNKKVAGKSEKDNWSSNSAYFTGLDKNRYSEMGRRGIKLLPHSYEKFAVHILLFFKSCSI